MEMAVTFVQKNGSYIPNNLSINSRGAPCLAVLSLRPPKAPLSFLGPNLLGESVSLVNCSRPTPPTVAVVLQAMMCVRQQHRAQPSQCQS